MKKDIAKKLQLKKIIVKNLNTKTGVKGGTTNNSCTSGGSGCRCHLN